MMRAITTVFSYLFHPLLALTYILIILMWIDPTVFASYSVGGKKGLLAMTFFSTFLIPALAVVMLYKLDFVKSIKMPKHKDRIVPLLIAMTCYYSVFAFLFKQVDSPDIFQVATLGACMAMSIAFIITIFYKISLHAIGMGAMLAMTVYACFYYGNINVHVDLGFLGTYYTPLLVILFIIVLLAGIVMSARLYLKAHTPLQVYSGIILGFVVQFIAFPVFQLFQAL